MRGTGYWEVRKMGRVEEKEGRMEGSEAGFTGFMGFTGLKEVGNRSSLLQRFVPISEILR